MTKPTWMDRAIARVAPSVGVRRLRSRMEFEAMTGKYKGASRTRDASIGWSAPSGDADEDTLADLPTLRSRSRDLSRNNPLAGGAIRTKIGSVVGTGLKLHASVDREYLGLSDDQADEIEGNAEREFNFWANSTDCDIARTLSFPEQQELAFSSVLENGDHFVLLTANESSSELALQHIEADRVCNESNVTDTDTLIAGVRKTPAGAPIEYHVMDGHPGGYRRRKMTWTKLPAFDSTGHRNVLHLYRKLRAGQTRGIPDLAPVIEPLKQMDRYTDAEIDAAVKDAMVAMVIKTESGQGLAGINDLTSWAGERKEFYKNSPVNFKGGSSGIVGLFPDDSMTSFDPGRPNQSFDPFMQAMSAQIGVALELPQEVITKRFQSSYSAAKAALVQAWQYFMGRRAWMARNFCQPVYSRVLYDAVVSGRIAAPGFLQDQRIRAAYSGAEWVGDAQGQIDETKAVAAAVARIDADLSTKKRETAALTGEDHEKVRRQRDKERRQEPETQVEQVEQVDNE